MQKVEIKETQCNVYDNLYSIQRIYPNLDNFESIDLAEPHGKLIDADAVKKILHSGVSLDCDEDVKYVCDLIDEIPTILEASNKED